MFFTVWTLELFSNKDPLVSRKLESWNHRVPSWHLKVCKSNSDMLPLTTDLPCYFAIPFYVLVLLHQVSQCCLNKRDEKQDAALLCTSARGAPPLSEAQSRTVLLHAWNWWQPVVAMRWKLHTLKMGKCSFPLPCGY